MAFNPYAISGSILQGLQTEASKKTRKQKSDIAIATQKQKMISQFESELEAKEKAAQAALQRKYKSKGLGNLVSIALAMGGLPIAAAATGGVSAAVEGKRAGKHALSMAELAKKHAMDIDPRWKGTFLGRDASKYLRESEKGYGDIVSQARDIKQETGGLGGMLKTGLMSGITSFAMGKAMQGIGDKFAAVKDVKALKGTDFKVPVEGTSLPSDIGYKAVQLDPKGMPMTSKVGIKDLAAKHGLSENVIKKLMEAKAPGLKALFGSIGEAGEKFGTVETGGYATTLAGLLAMLQGAQQGTYK